MTNMLGIAALSIAGTDPRRCIKSTDLPASAWCTGATGWMLNLPSGGDLRRLRRNWQRVYRSAADGALYVMHGRHGHAYLSNDIIGLLYEVNAAARLEELRAELRAENISYAELAELQSLAAHIEPGDVELLEAAGVPEFPDEEPALDTLEQLAAEAEVALEAIEESTEADSMDDVFAARDGAGDVLTHLIAFVKGAQK